MRTAQPQHATPKVHRFPIQLVIMRRGCPLGVAIEIGRTRLVIARERSRAWHIAAMAERDAFILEMYANQGDML